jgi:hypothetical protein
LAQKNITNFERSNIAQYLVFEGLDVVRQSTLLADVECKVAREVVGGPRGPIVIIVEVIQCKVD